MKLFKNRVGRPSNEVKQMWRIFVVCIVAIVISVVALLVSLLSKSGILTSNLKGATSYSVSYGLWNKNSSDITIRAYPSYRAHNGTVRFPAAPSYTVKSGKTCSFKGWIFQKQNDGRYRYRTTSGSYVWYRSSLDSGKYKVSNYAFFKPGSSYKLGAIKVKLYAAFDCGIGSNSSNGNSTNSAISPSINLGGTLSVGSSTSKFNVKTTESSVSVTSSNTSVLQVIKYGNNTPGGNSWALKAKKKGKATIITAGNKKATYSYTVN